MTLKEFYRLNNSRINSAISAALREDMVNRDVTTALIPGGKTGDRKINAVLLCKQDCTLAGLDIFKRVYKTVDPSVKFREYCKDGDKLKKGKIVLEVRASLRKLLVGERTALNFLQRMSGIATLTAGFVKMLKYKNAKILHTRKTTPNFRVFEAAAVKTGGGEFHRLSLNSAVMIKDNHIEVFGSVENTLAYLKNRKFPDRLKQNFEIEVKSLNEAKTVVKLGKGLVKIVMLDNFKLSELDAAIDLLRSNGFKTEASGGINLKNFSKIQRKGIDFYSIGMLTHSYMSCDFSLEF